MFLNKEEKIDEQVANAQPADLFLNNVVSNTIKDNIKEYDVDMTDGENNRDMDNLVTALNKGETGNSQ